MLFDIYAEAMLREALDGIDEGIWVGRYVIRTVRYADDQATVASSVEGLQLMMKVSGWEDTSSEQCDMQTIERLLLVLWKVYN